MSSKKQHYSKVKSKDSFSRGKFGFIILGGGIGLFLSILGNLISTWLQQDIIKNAFTPNRLLIILFITLLGVFVSGLLEYFSSQKIENNEIPPHGSGVFLNLMLLWSKFKSFGNKVTVKNVYSIKSEIEIDTRDLEEK